MEIEMINGFRMNCLQGNMAGTEVWIFEFVFTCSQSFFMI